MTQRTDTRGFTLVEMLVALTLMGLMSVGLLEGFHYGQRAYQQALRVDQASWDVFNVQRFLRRTLESAYPFEPDPGQATTRHGLEGTANALQYTAPAPMAEGGAGYYRYELVLRTRDGGGQDLWVRWHVDRGSQPFTETKDNVQEEKLLERVAALDWDYFEVPDAPGNGSAARWVPRWQDSQALPALVRLRIRFPVGDPRVWPEFVVAPRVDTDANCQFDVVSQRCRAVST